MNTLSGAPFNTYIIAVKSTHVKEAVILLMSTNENEPETRTLDDVSVVIGATTGRSEKEALEKIAQNHDLPNEILTAYIVQ